MEFKIDTTATYTHITPLYGHLNANMAAAVADKCTELSEEASQNFLIDLINCQDAEESAFEELVALHESCYTSGQSLVFTGAAPAVMTGIRAAAADLALNIAPTKAEAVDIISMEILERDLFNEES